MDSALRFAELKNRVLSGWFDNLYIIINKRLKMVKLARKIVGMIGGIVPASNVGQGFGCQYLKDIGVVLL